VAPLGLLNVALLFALFTTAGGQPFSLTLLATQYGYFIPLLAMSAAVGSWETELFAGIGEEYLLRSRWILPSRLLSSLVECLVPCALFILLVATSSLPHKARQLGTAGLMLLVFYLFGSALGFYFGFRHEKAVNNFLVSVTWVLGFGPGPFFGTDATGYRALFPGGFSVTGRFGLEAVKLGVVAGLAGVLLYLARRPRRFRYFAK
jgi:hypothetical protein